MKVSAKSSALSAVGWLEKGEFLTVLAVSVTPFEGVKLLLWSSLQESVSLFPGADFYVVDNCLSRRWVFSVDSQGGVYLAPDAWQIDGFWERYHDGDPVAEQVFTKEMDFILSE
ncbi:hypothetical protein [Pseudomonas abyssi]|uniref:hypothetical protein n=1 Tax=Pseudomonas abyssi TaxID=170540 RepID=UPI003C797584